MLCLLYELKKKKKKQSVPCLSILALNTKWLRGLERTIQTIPNIPESMTQVHFAHFNLNFFLGKIFSFRPKTVNNFSSTFPFKQV